MNIYTLHIDEVKVRLIESENVIYFYPVMSRCICCNLENVV